MNIVLYTKPNCSFCEKAKLLLNVKNLPFSEQVLGSDFTKEFLLERYPDASTYPVVVIDGFDIGGYNELLMKLNEESYKQTHEKLLMESK
jgi:glutaredoxin